MAEPPARWVLLVLGNGELRTYPLAARAEILLGRDLDCNVVLDHHRVSRRHARLRIPGVRPGADDALAIEDLGSRSGTRVGEALRRNQRCAVRPGDPIGIGPFTVTAVRGTALPGASLVIEAPVASALPAVLLGVARSAANVLVRCAPGAGAQVLAEGLHHLSGRGGRFVSIDCAAIAPGLLERELFGHRGTSAPGALEAAGEGTLLLEAVGELPLLVQRGLLHAIERRATTRAGGTAPIASSARLVCATAHDLLASVEAGVFRLDLYYRMAGATVTIRPPGPGRAPG